MSVRILTGVFEHSDSTLGARLVLIAIADAAHDDGVAWPTQETLRTKTLMSDSTVRAAVKALDADGELEVQKVQRGQKRINVYRVLMPGAIEVDPERLPFALPAPFVRPLKSGGRSRRGSTVATADFPGFLAGAQDDGGTTNVRGTSVANATSGAGAREEPPALVKIDGRNVALDALCEVTGVDEKSPRFQATLRALNGRVDGAGKLKDPGIKHLFWIECVRFAEEHDALDRLNLAYTDEREAWSLALERRIREKAERYAHAYPGAALSPQALRNHWLDLELQQRRGGLLPHEIEQLSTT